MADGANRKVEIDAMPPEPSCPLCGDDPNDPTLHAETCRTVVENLCGVIENGQMCMAPDHLTRDPDRQLDWKRWRAGHEWAPLDQISRPGQPKPGDPS